MVKEREMDELVKAVREHAVANYEKHSWDFLVECWDDADVAREIATAKTVAGAIRNCKAALQGLNEQRREVQSEIF